jgi:uncharacterized protein YndB with AHSA1/START domain
MSNTEFVYMAIIAAPREKVWEALTTAEFTRQYWHGTRVDSDCKKGSAIEFRKADDQVGVRGEILESSYPERLSYSWQFLQMDETADDSPSRVTFELEALDVGTRLLVIHDQLEHAPKTAEMVAFGWPHVICGLKTLLETERAVDFSLAKAS